MELKCKIHFIKYYQNIEKGITSQYVFDGDDYYSFNKDVHRISGETFYCLKSNKSIGFTEKEIFTFFYTEGEVRQQKISKVLGDE